MDVRIDIEGDTGGFLLSFRKGCPFHDPCLFGHTSRRAEMGEVRGRGWEDLLRALEEAPMGSRDYSRGRLWEAVARLGDRKEDESGDDGPPGEPLGVGFPASGRAEAEGEVGLSLEQYLGEDPIPSER